MKPSILFILHLPPPTHGASMIGQYIRESNLIQSEFSGDFVDLTTTRQLNATTKNGMDKLRSFAGIQKNVFNALRKKKYDLCYMTLTATGPGFYKDLLVVALLKLFRQKRVYHFHNKGVAAASGSVINRVLYRFVFKNASCILLSDLLYYDIERYVKKSDVFFCPNGIPVIPLNSREKPAESQDTKGRILFLSNMMAQKGVYVLLEACKILKERGLHFECHFIGAWSDVSEEDFQATVADQGL